MKCVRCGGTALKAISPGYWLCESLVVRQVMAPAGPAGQMVPVGESALCGHRFQSGPGASTDRCSCGTFAVGACAECGQFVCGDHSALDGQLRLCSMHLEARRAAVRQQADEEAELRRRLLEFERGRPRRLALGLVAALAAAGNPSVRPFWSPNLGTPGVPVRPLTGRAGRRVARAAAAERARSVSGQATDGRSVLAEAVAKAMEGDFEGVAPTYEGWLLGPFSWGEVDGDRGTQRSATRVLTTDGDVMRCDAPNVRYPTLHTMPGSVRDLSAEEMAELLDALAARLGVSYQERPASPPARN